MCEFWTIVFVACRCHGTRAQSSLTFLQLQGSMRVRQPPPALPSAMMKTLRRRNPRWRPGSRSPTSLPRQNQNRIPFLRLIIQEARPAVLLGQMRCVTARLYQNKCVSLQLIRCIAGSRTFDKSRQRIWRRVLGQDEKQIQIYEPGSL